MYMMYNNLSEEGILPVPVILPITYFKLAYMKINYII
jgi:hypothetical protein